MTFAACLIRTKLSANHKNTRGLDQGRKYLQLEETFPFIEPINVCLQFMNNEQHGKVLLYSPSVWSWWGHRIYPSPAGFPRGGCSWSPSPWVWGWTWTAPPWTPSSCTCFPSGRTSREVWPTMEEDCSWLRIECFCPHTVKENHFCLTILLSQIDIVWQNYSRYM